ncbi:hypothetical protein ABW19_dt0201050 [Dactylella cylindrospora]|nr:hypothetical protein ABW19_dt0201050 [Dactylella cylindrospora]
MDPEGELVSGSTAGQDNFQIGSAKIETVIMGLANAFTIPPSIALSARRNTEEYIKFLDSLLWNEITNTMAYSIYLTEAVEGNVIDYYSGKILFGMIDETQFFGDLKAFDTNQMGIIPVSGIYWIDNKAQNTSLVPERSTAGEYGVAEISLSP